MYVVGYFMALAFYYGAIKSNLGEVSKTSAKTLTPVEQSEYTPPLPMPTPNEHSRNRR